MRRFEVTTPVAAGLHENDGVVLELTEDDANDLNEGHSITTLTTQGEEVGVVSRRNRIGRPVCGACGNTLSNDEVGGGPPWVCFYCVREGAASIHGKEED